MDKDNKQNNKSVKNEYQQKTDLIKNNMLNHKSVQLTDIEKIKNIKEKLKLVEKELRELLEYKKTQKTAFRIGKGKVRVFKSRLNKNFKLHKHLTSLYISPTPAFVDLNKIEKTLKTEHRLFNQSLYEKKQILSDDLYNVLNDKLEEIFISLKESIDLLNVDNARIDMTLNSIEEAINKTRKKIKEYNNLLAIEQNDLKSQNASLKREATELTKTKKLYLKGKNVNKKDS